MSWGKDAPQNVAHTPAGDAATARPCTRPCANRVLRSPVPANPHARERSPSRPWRDDIGMKSFAPHSMALAVAHHLQLRIWQRRGPRCLGRDACRRKRSTSVGRPGALFGCRGQHRGRAVSGGGHVGFGMPAGSLGVASGSGFLHVTAPWSVVGRRQAGRSSTLLPLCLRPHGRRALLSPISASRHTVRSRGCHRASKHASHLRAAEHARVPPIARSPASGAQQR